MSQPNPIRSSNVPGVAVGDIANADHLPDPPPTRGKALDAGGGDPITLSGGGSASDASTTVKGVTLLSAAPASPTSPIAVADTDTRIPTQTENDALAGTSGVPATGNRYITDSDPRVPTQAENDALAGTSGAPAPGNRYVTDSDPRNTNARAPSGAAGGDLGLNYPTPIVVQLNGRAVTAVVFTDDVRLADQRTPLDNSVSQPKIQDLAVTPRKASDLLRNGGWVPSGAIDQTIPDRLSATAVQTLTSGTLYLSGGIVVPGGRPVSSISFMSGSTALASGTHQWFCLVDTALNVLATTIDDVANTWATNTVKTLQLATTLGGGTPGGTWTPANAIEVYAGVCVTATTPPNLKGTTSNTALSGIAPVQTATSTTGLTTPASLGATAGALSSMGTIIFAFVS